MGMEGGENLVKRLNLVTGACGFSGMYLVRLLLQAGERVVATDLESAFTDAKRRMIIENLDLDLRHPNLEILPANLLDKASLATLFEKPVTHVFHTASLYDYSAPLELLEKLNIEGFTNFVEAALHADLKRFVHWSTCGVFGRPYKLTERRANTPFNEESSSPKNAPEGTAEPDGTYLVNEYSVTKWRQEQLAWSYHREQGLPLTVIRPAPIYGPGSDYGHGGIIMAIHKGWLPIIPADARNYITVSVHSEDIARFAHYVSDLPQGLGEDYNVVDDSIISFSEFLHYIALLTGRRMYDAPFLYLKALKPFAIRAAYLWDWLEKKFKVPRVRVFEKGSAVYVASSYWIANDKTKATGFAYRYPDVRVGLRETVQWFRKVGWIR